MNDSINWQNSTQYGTDPYKQVSEIFYFVYIGLAVLISCLNTILIIWIISGPASRKQPFNIIIISQAVSNLFIGIMICSFIAVVRKTQAEEDFMSKETLGMNETFCEFLGFMTDAFMCTMTWMAMSVTIHRTILLTSSVHMIVTIILAVVPWIIGIVSVAALKVPLASEFAICEFYSDNQTLKIYWIVVSLAIPGFFLLASASTCIVSGCGRNHTPRHVALSTSGVYVTTLVVIVLNVPLHIMLGNNECFFNDIEDCRLAIDIVICLQFSVSFLLPIIALLFPEVHTRKLVNAM